MTAIAGMFCQDGLVIGADSSATFGVGSFKTIEQPTEKICIIKDCVIVACTGQVGLAQRFEHVVEIAHSNKKFTGHYLEVGKELCRAAISDFSSTSSTKGSLGALVGFPLGGTEVHLCEFTQTDFQPEFKNKSTWFASMGSGLHITDPFLALMRNVFWESCTYGKPHTHGSRDRSRGRGAGERWQREHRGRALRERRRVAGVLRTFLRPPRGVHGLPGGDRPWRSSGRVTMGAVVQAAHVRHRNDLARCSRLDASAHGRILAQREMRAPEMVVVDVRSQYSVE